MPPHERRRVQERELQRLLRAAVPVRVTQTARHMHERGRRVRAEVAPTAELGLGQQWWHRAHARARAPVATCPRREPAVRQWGLGRRGWPRVFGQREARRVLEPERRVAIGRPEERAAVAARLEPNQRLGVERLLLVQRAAVRVMAMALLFTGDKKGRRLLHVARGHARSGGREPRVRCACSDRRC